MKTLLLSALLLVGLAGCGGSNSSSGYKPTALDSAVNGLYKVRPKVRPPAAVDSVKK